MIDVDALLSPISEGSPTGEDLRWVDGDLTFSTIEGNRVDEDPALVFEGDPKSADWKLVSATAEEALESKSKDLQLVAWLTEGLAQLHGFAGLAQGLQLAHRMLDQYWDTLYPGFDDGEVSLDTRAKPLGWLTSPRGFLPSVREIAIAHKEHRWADFERALQIEQIGQSRPTEAQEMLAQGGMSREHWIQTLQAMGAPAIGELVDSIRSAEAELQQLMEVCNRRFGYDDAPLLNPLQELLEEIRGSIEPHGGDASPDAAVAHEPAAQGPAASLPASGAGAASAGPVANRQAALQQLSEVARFFRETEPHSPMAPLIERAVRWGNMSFQELFAEVVNNDSALAHVWETLGIDPSAPSPPQDLTPSPSSAPAAPADTPSSKSEDAW